MNKYHYTECGLDNIYLTNGFEITKTKNGDKEIFIHDIHGLHKTIGNILVFKRGLLAGNEIKFIRTTLDLSQKSLGNLLGLDYQTVLGWEKNKFPISKTADRFLKIIFYSFLNKEADATVYDKINEIANMDAETIEAKRIELKEVKDEWRLTAA
jgi:DNA-binding transcriptional regulator YiaG